MNQEIIHTSVPRVVSLAGVGFPFAIAFAFIMQGFVGLDETISTLSETQGASVTLSKIKSNKNIDAVVTNEAPKETNRIIVKYKEKNLPPGLQIAVEKANLEKAQGLREVLTIKGINAVVYEVSENDTASEVIDRIKEQKKDLIEYAEVDMLVAPALIPNDALFGSQWHHPKVQTPVAWDSAQGAEVVVATLDTGVDGTHPDLSFSTQPGWNMYDNNSDTRDVYGHGTKVAGTANAIGNNAIGVSGVAPEAKVMAVRISSLTGGATFSNMANGIVYAADHGARVANISYENACGSASVISAASYMRGKGGVVVLAAGNSGADTGFVANDQITCVSATDSNDARTSWSSFGNSTDVSAPGAGIYTTTNGGGYGGVSGTSFASPLTAGIYALMFSANPALTPNQADGILFSSVDDLGVPGWDIYYGHGRVNASKAVTVALSAVGTRDTVAPSVPGNLRTTSVSANTIALTWSASTDDNSGVAGYSVYRNGVKLATVTGTSYTNTGLIANTTYTYTVRAEDVAGNQSAESSQLSVSTPDVSFGIASYSISTKTANSATVSATLTKPGTVTVKYGTSATNLTLTAQGSTTPGLTSTVPLTNLTAFTTYYYQVVATDGTTNVTSAVSNFKTAKATGGGKPQR